MIPTPHRDGAPDPRLVARLRKHIDAVPVLPATATEVMSLDRTSPRFFDRVKRIVEGDPGVAVRVLSVANSAASAPRAPITALSAAIMRIGSTNTADLVLAAAVTRVFAPRHAWQRDVWRHAIAVAVCARALAGYERAGVVSAEDAYAAALLHDVGRFVLMLGAPAAILPAENPSDPAAMLAEERAVFGVTHPEVGEMTCERWKLPAFVGHVVRTHHAPASPPSTREERMTALVALADVAMSASSDPAFPREAIERLAASLLDVSWSSFEAVTQAARVEAETMSQALGLGAPG